MNNLARNYNQRRAFGQASVIFCYFFVITFLWVVFFDADLRVEYQDLLGIISSFEAIILVSLFLAVKASLLFQILFLLTFGILRKINKNTKNQEDIRILKALRIFYSLKATKYELLATGVILMVLFGEFTIQSLSYHNLVKLGFMYALVLFLNAIFYDKQKIQEGKKIRVEEVRI